MFYAGYDKLNNGVVITGVRHCSGNAELQVIVSRSCRHFLGSACIDTRSWGG